MRKREDGFPVPIQDEYLVEGKSFERLLTEYRKYGSLAIAFDFDNTVYDYHKSGQSYEQVIQLLKDLKSIGCKIICWTAQKDLELVISYLEEKGIEHDGINVEGIPLPWETRKPFYSATLDDRCGLIQVFNDLTLLVKTIKNV